MFEFLYLFFWAGLALLITGGEGFMSNTRAAGLLVVMVTGYIFTRAIWRHVRK